MGEKRGGGQGGRKAWPEHITGVCMSGCSVHIEIMDAFPVTTPCDDVSVQASLFERSVPVAIGTCWRMGMVNLSSLLQSSVMLP